MGAIHVGIDPMLGREVVIKTIRHGEADDVSTARLYREARAVAKLHHPNIVTVYDLVEEQGALFIVMEKVDGGDFKQIISRREPLPVLAKLNLMVQTCAGVEHAHQHGILHGDLKPGNLFLTRRASSK
jgi:serine/threonine-protein kinase